MSLYLTEWTEWPSGQRKGGRVSASSWEDAQAMAEADGEVVVGLLVEDVTPPQAHPSEAAPPSAPPRPRRPR